MTAESSVLASEPVVAADTLEAITVGAKGDQISFPSCGVQNDSIPLEKDEINSAETSDESLEPSLEADASHASTLASTDTFGTFEEYPFLQRIINSCAQCVDDIQERTVCQGQGCTSQEKQKVTPSLLHRSQCGTEKPSAKLRRHTNNRETYLDRFTARHSLESGKSKLDPQEGTDELTKSGALDRIKNLMHRKPDTHQASRSRNCPHGRPKAKQHRRQKREKAMSKKELSPSALEAVIETAHPDLMADTPKFQNSSKSRQTLPTQEQEDKYKCIKSSVSQSDDAMDAFSIITDTGRVEQYSQSSTVLEVTTPKLSAIKKGRSPSFADESSGGHVVSPRKYSTWLAETSPREKFDRCLSVSTNELSLKNSMGKSSTIAKVIRENSSKSPASSKQEVIPPKDSREPIPSALMVSPLDTTREESPTKSPQKHAKSAITSKLVSTSSSPITKAPQECLPTSPFSSPPTSPRQIASKSPRKRSQYFGIRSIRN